MDLKEFRDLFEKECLKNNIEFKADKVEDLFKYMNLVKYWNKITNITAITDDTGFVVKHFIDSLIVNTYLKDVKRIIDIGTGAGFPGIPLKIYNPNISVTLIDSVNKKVNVLKDVIEKLNLKDIEAIHIRAEDLAENEKYREKFQVVLTRAVSNLTTISEYMLPFVELNGRSICMKGPNIEDELKEANNAIKILGGKIEKIDKFNISNQFERNLIIIKKVKKTDKKYPRKQGKPLKEPLK